MRILLLVVSCSILLGCKNSNAAFIIEGTLPSVNYDGEWIFLVPMKNAPGRVDSVKIVNATFTFKGEDEEMRVVRVRHSLRMEIQELLVVTEPGSIQLKADTLGVVKGTPQNDALQRWKEECEKKQKESRLIYQRLKTASKEDSVSLMQSLDTLKAHVQQMDYRLLKEQGNNTLGTFMKQMLYSTLSEEQQKNLNEESL